MAVNHLPIKHETAKGGGEENKRGGKVILTGCINTPKSYFSPWNCPNLKIKCNFIHPTSKFLFCQTVLTMLSM